jgi:chromosome segregation ATPase
MFRFMGRMTRWGVIGALGLAGLIAVVGLTRVKTAWWSVRDHLRSNVDELVDTRVALQHEVRKLQEEYPERIADLRCQVKEIDRDLTACTEDVNLCQEVVALCESDITVLNAKLQVADSDADGLGPDLVEFRSEKLGRAEALTRAGRIAETASSYRARLEDLTAEQQILRDERSRLRAELADMEREFTEFQTDAGTISREIDSLKRKEKLVKVAERRQEETDDIFSDRASGLIVVKEKIERRKIQLDERLRALGGIRTGNEYEARARLRLVEGGN